eukprot:403357082
MKLLQSTLFILFIVISIAFIEGESKVLGNIQEKALDQHLGYEIRKLQSTNDNTTDNSSTNTDNNSTNTDTNNTNTDTNNTNTDSNSTNTDTNSTNTNQTTGDTTTDNTNNGGAGGNNGEEATCQNGQLDCTNFELYMEQKNYKWVTYSRDAQVSTLIAIISILITITFLFLFCNRRLHKGQKPRKQKKKPVLSQNSSLASLQQKPLFNIKSKTKIGIKQNPSNGSLRNGPGENENKYRMVQNQNTSMLNESSQNKTFNDQTLITQMNEDFDNIRKK